MASIKNLREKIQGNQPIYLDKNSEIIYNKFCYNQVFMSKYTKNYLFHAGTRV